MAKNGVVIPYDYLEEMEKLSDEEFGQLMRALIKYSATGERIDLEGNAGFFQNRVMIQEDKQNNKYNEVASARSNAGKKGAEARWQTMANDGKKEKAMAKDSKKKKEVANDSKQMANDGKNAVKLSKDKSSSLTPPTPPTDEKDRSPVLRDAINKWLKYKAERKQKYEPTSLETLLKKIDKAAEQYGESAVVKLIDECIANHYQGIIWDRLGQQPARKEKQPAVTEAENKARLQKDLEWLEKFSARSASGGG